MTSHATVMTGADIAPTSPRCCAGDSRFPGGVLMRVFVTGASGWIGSALLPELIGAGHQVVGLARSDSSADAIAAAGAEVYRGTLDDLDALRGAAAASDGVIHLAFQHDLAFSGRVQDAAAREGRLVRDRGSTIGRPTDDLPRRSMTTALH